MTRERFFDVTVEAGHDMEFSAENGQTEFFRESGTVDGTRLARYVAGACSAREKEAVEQWIAEDEARAALVGELRQAWALTDQQSLPKKNVEAALKRLHAKMQAHDEKRQADESASAPKREATGRHARRRILHRRPKAATLLRTTVALALMAVAAVLLIAFGLLGAPVTGGRDAPQARVYHTEKGQRALITLPDGSVVHLNAQSTLAVSAEYVEERVVRLEGEAYFDVAPREGRPFVIRTARATVRVLGTAFAVRAYTSESAAHVVVAEGRVAVHSKARAQRPASSDTLAPGPAVVLRPRQLAVVSKGGLLTTRHHVDLDRYLAWTEGCLVFEEAPFEEVVTELERWYDLQIDVTFPYGAARPFNGTFEGESLDEVLTIIATSLHLVYEREGRHITFSRAGAAAESSRSEASHTAPVQITR